MYYKHQSFSNFRQVSSVGSIDNRDERISITGERRVAAFADKLVGYQEHETGNRKHPNGYYLFKRL